MQAVTPATFGVRQAEQRDLDGMVRVHQAAFPEYFGTNLGRGLLTRYYREFLCHPQAVSVVVENDAGICGFIVGYRGRAPVMDLFWRRHLLYVTGCVLLKLVTLNPVIWRGLVARLGHVRVAARALFSRRPAVAASSTTPEQPAIAAARLLSIAVLPACRGTGCAETVMRFFEQALRERGLALAELTVNSDNARAIHFYRKAGWNVAKQGQHSIAFAKRL